MSWLLRRLLLSALLALILFPSTAFPEDTVLTADTVEQTGTTYIAKGRVKFVKGNVTVRADEATYDSLTGEASLAGSVSFDSPLVTMRAERASMNIETETGVLYDAGVFVKKDNFHLKSREIEKGRALRFSLKDASLTSCDAPVPAWCFKGKRIDVLLGEEVTGKSVSFRVRDFPVFYTPYFWAPVLIERKSGLLIPTMGFNDTKGFYWRQPYFWAVSENRDATLFLDLYTKRGIGQGAEYRFIERGGIEGSDYLYHIRDTELKEDFYELRGENRFVSKNGSGSLGINYVNNGEFFKLYKPFIEDRSRRFLESTLTAEKRLAPAGGPISSRLYLRGNYMVELKEGVGQSQVSQRLPEAGYVYNPKGRGPFYFSFDTALSNFERGEGPEGQRLSLGLRAGHSVGKAVTLFQSASLRESFYRLSGFSKENLNRMAAGYSATLESRFQKRWGGLTHAAIPSVSYRHSSFDGDSPPLFDSAELRLPRDAAELSLMNRLFDHGGELASLKLAGEFNSDEESMLKLGLTLRRPVTVRVFSSYDLRGGSFGDSSLNADAKVKNTSVSFGQQYSGAADTLLYTLGAEHEFSKALSLGAKLWYDSKGGELTDLRADALFRRQCWSLNVSLVRRPGDLSAFFTIELKGLGTFGG